jgi:hypothetical protein
VSRISVRAVMEMFSVYKPSYREEERAHAHVYVAYVCVCVYIYISVH